MLDLRQLSFGAPAAIVTSMGLIVGLDAATATKAMVVGSLLIAGIADNLTDTLSVHIYQESERFAARQAFRTTIANFTARLIVSASFILLILLLPTLIAMVICVIWGFLLLSGLSYLLAKTRGANPLSEICKHTGVALVVIAISQSVGFGIRSMMGSA